jgi:phospholipid/cholesterol/gamma-HCH transport system substrate-binding protein
MVVGFLSFSYLALRLGDVRLLADPTYTVTARFRSISGLQKGGIIEIAGVRIGQVADIRLDPQSYDAVVEMAIDRAVELQADSIASIRTTGIIGEKYINISPGGADDAIPPGGEIMETESAISLEEVLSRYIFQQ